MWWEERGVKLVSLGFDAEQSVSVAFLVFARPESKTQQNTNVLWSFSKLSLEMSFTK